MFKVALRQGAFAAALMGSLLPFVQHASAQDSDEARAPLVLKKQGTFFVGGRDRAVDATNSRAPSPGTITIHQMYVQYQTPMPSGAPKTPVIMVHGCCLTSKSWQDTPDGRMGWNEYFVRQGYPTYLAEQVSRGRSGFDPTILNEVALGLDGKTAKDIPFIYSIGHEGAYTGFRFGPKFGTPYPDSQFPLDSVDQFYRQMVPDLNGFLGKNYPPTPNPTYNNLSKLAIRLGGAVIIGHSESGFFPQNAALVDTADIKGMVSIEPGGSCTTTNPGTTPLTPNQIKTLAKIPTLIMFGDHLTDNWAASFKNCMDYKAKVTAAGGDVSFVHLPNLGMHGNSHMMMIDKNNLQVADVIIKWIANHVDKKQ